MLIQKPPIMRINAVIIECDFEYQAGKPAEVESRVEAATGAKCVVLPRGMRLAAVPPGIDVRNMQDITYLTTRREG